MNLKFQRQRGMTIKKLFEASLLISGGLCLGEAVPAKGENQNVNNSKPNILFIYSDQHRWSALNCYGNSEVLSPNFDRLAKEGVLFSHAFSSCPVCAPARASIQTGLHTHQHQVRGNEFPWVGQHFKSMADYFNDAGYETCMIGKTHWGKYLYYDMKWTGGYVPPQRRMRWKHWFATDGHNQYGSAIYDDQANIVRSSEGKDQVAFHTDLAIEFMEKFRDKPWIMQLNWGPPHTIGPGPTVKYTPEYYIKALELNKQLGFNLPEELFTPENQKIVALLMPQALLFDIVPKKYLDLYALQKITVDPNVPEQYRNVAKYHYIEYYALISMLDDELGRLLDFLKNSGLDKNTLVIYSSDHGDRIAAHCTLKKFRTKSSWHQNSARVPFIVSGPKLGVPCGKQNRTPVGTVDILPTMLDVAGIKPETGLPGESFKKCFSEDCVEIKRNVLMSLDPWRAITDGRYIYAIEDRKNSWTAISLIDMDNDPWDSNNLLDNPVLAEIQQRLHKDLVESLIKTDDHDFVLRTGLKTRELK